MRPTACDVCETALSVEGQHYCYSLGCEYCAARHLLNLGRMGLDRQAVSDRRRAALAEYVSYGCDEQEIRKMVADKQLVYDTRVIPNSRESKKR